MLDPPFSPDVRTARTPSVNQTDRQTRYTACGPKVREQQISIQEIPLSQVNKHFPVISEL